MIWFIVIFTSLSISSLIYWILSPSLTYKKTNKALAINKIWFIIWPWVSLFAFLFSPIVSWRYKQKIKLELIKAGRLDALDVSDFIGMQFFVFIFSFVLVFISSFFIFLLDTEVSLLLAISLSFLGFTLPHYQLKKQIQQRQNQLLKLFPFFLDMITLCVEAGLSFQVALIQTSQMLPEGPLKKELSHTLSEIRTGVSKTEALKSLAHRVGLKEFSYFVASVSQSEGLGAELGSILRAQSEQRRVERFLKAEKLALEAPVKMLLPLVLCIFPCTFIILAFPIGMKFLSAAW